LQILNEMYSSVARLKKSYKSTIREIKKNKQKPCPISPELKAHISGLKSIILCEKIYKKACNAGEIYKRMVHHMEAVNSLENEADKEHKEEKKPKYTSIKDIIIGFSMGLGFNCLLGEADESTSKMIIDSAFISLGSYIGIGMSKLKPSRAEKINTSLAVFVGSLAGQFVYHLGRAFF